MQINKRTAWIIADIALAVLLIFVLVIINLSAKVAKMEQAQKVEKVAVLYQNVLNTDSLKTAIEKTVFDSLRVMRAQFQNDLKKVRDENAANRTQSQSIRTKYDNIFIDRPDF